MGINVAVMGTDEVEGIELTLVAAVQVLPLRTGLDFTLASRTTT